MAVLQKERQQISERAFPGMPTGDETQEPTATAGEAQPVVPIKTATSRTPRRRTVVTEPDSTVTDAVSQHRPAPKIVWAMSLASLALLIVVAVAFYMRSRSAKQEPSQGPPEAVPVTTPQPVRSPSPRIVITQH